VTSVIVEKFVSICSSTLYIFQAAPSKHRGAWGTLTLPFDGPGCIKKLMQ